MDAQQLQDLEARAKAALPNGAKGPLGEVMKDLLTEVRRLHFENCDLRQRLRCGGSDDLEPVAMGHWRT
jgi:hypothetical protein